MQTFKTATVVVILLGVLYGAYVVLNKPELKPPPEVSQQSMDDLKPPVVGAGGDAAGDSFSSLDSLGSPMTFDEGPGATEAPTGQQYQSPAIPPNGGVEPGSPPEPGNEINTQAPPAPDFGEETTSQYAPSSQYDASTSFAPPAPPVGPGDAGNPPPGTPAAGDAAANNYGNDSRYGTPDTATAPGANTAPNASQDPGDAVLRNTGGQLTYNTFVQPNSGSGASSNPTASKASYSGPTSAVASGAAFDRAKRSADQQTDSGDLNEALATLSVFYHSPDLNEQEHKELVARLDQLAARVIYSREHLSEAPYRVRKYDTLADIAAQYKVPVKLLQNINSIRNPDVLVPGSELKVLQGPFEALVDLSRKELTLFVQQRYAGRFAFTVGNDPAPRPGKYWVRSKQFDRQYIMGTGRREIAGGRPSNPYGHHWLDLGEQMCIHGTAERPLSTEGGLGCISLSPRDAADVFGILSEGSKVTIRQ